MRLQLKYPDKYRLWSKLLRANADRVFIATDEPPDLGATVPLDVVLAQPAVPIVLQVQVIGRRSQSPRFSAGVYVRIGDEEMDKCRRLLDLAHAPRGWEKGRKARRVSCERPVRFVEPPASAAATTKNLSEIGMLVLSALPVAEGAQLGLAVRLGDGDLEVKGDVTWSDPRRGLFGVRFSPLDSSALSRLRDELDRAERDSAAARPTVVVADDEPEILLLLATLLRKHGYEVYQASEGRSCLGLIRELAPRLVILDILMPGLDGADICKTMRADVELADIPVIFYSALDEAQLHEVADEAGASDYLSKPTSLNDVVNLVGHYLK